MKRILAFILIFVLLMTSACSKPKDDETYISADNSIQEEQSTDNFNTEKDQRLDSITDNNTLNYSESEHREEMTDRNNNTEAVVDDGILEPYANSRSFDFDLSKAEDKAYSDFVKKLKDIYGYAVKDINNDDVSELIVNKPETMITVYSYNGKVFEAGSYKFDTATRRLLYSENYCGIIAFTVGGGANLYRYVTIKNDKLVLENIWKDYYAYDGVNITIQEEIFTSNKKLVSESEYVYNNSQDINFIEIKE